MWKIDCYRREFLPDSYITENIDGFDTSIERIHVYPKLMRFFQRYIQYQHKFVYVLLKAHLLLLK